MRMLVLPVGDGSGATTGRTPAQRRRKIASAASASPKSEACPNNTACAGNAIASPATITAITIASHASPSHRQIDPGSAQQ